MTVVNLSFRNDSKLHVVNVGLLFACTQKSEQPVFTITQDGDYHFTFIMKGQDFKANVHIEMRGSYGYLSAVDYPLLIVSYNLFELRFVVHFVTVGRFSLFVLRSSTVQCALST